MKKNTGGLSANVILPIATALFLLAYIATLQPVFGVLCIASFLTYVSLDFITGSGKTGKSTLLEIVYAILGAAVVWFVLSIALQTPSPIDVVTSCSMKPLLDRGDLVLVQGQQVYNAPVIDYSGAVPSLQASKSNCTISKRGNPDSTSQCTVNLTLSNQATLSTVSTTRSSVTQNDVVVFESRQSGLVIHRAVLALKSTETNQVLYLTKGDNNQVVDQEAGLDFVEPQKIHGRMIARVPLIGYLRLFLAGQFNEPHGCDTIVH